MLRKLTALISLVMLLSPFLLAMERPQEKVEFKLVQEKEFDKEIKDVGWGETEDGRLYPKIIVFEDEVRFYDEEELLVKSVPAKEDWVVISEQNKYVGVKMLKHAPQGKGDAKMEFQICGSRGEKLAGVEYEVSYDGDSPGWYISDKDGSFIGAHAGAQKLVFYNPDGIIIKKFDLFENDEWDIAKSMKCSFSKDGNYFAVLGANQYCDSAKNWHEDIYLILFDVQGKELWRRFLKDQRVVSLSVSPAGNFIVANAHLLFNGNSNLIGEYHGRVCRFSEDGKYLAIGGENTVQLLQTSTGEVIWSKKFSWPVDSREKEWRWVDDVQVTNKGRVGVISSLAKRRKGGYNIWDTTLIFLDTRGNRVEEKKFKGKQILKIGKTCKEMFSWTSTHIAKYEVIEE